MLPQQLARFRTVIESRLAVLRGLPAGARAGAIDATRFSSSASEDAARYRAQMQEYRSAMQTVYMDKTVRCALLFADGTLSETG